MLKHLVLNVFLNFDYCLLLLKANTLLWLAQIMFIIIANDHLSSFVQGFHMQTIVYNRCVNA